MGYGESGISFIGLCFEFPVSVSGFPFPVLVNKLYSSLSIDHFNIRFQNVFKLLYLFSALMA